MSFVNPFELSQATQAIVEPRHLENVTAIMIKRGLPMGSFLGIENLLSAAQAQALVDEVHQQIWQPVGLDGIAGKPIEKIGNYRLTNYNEPLALAMWTRLQGFLPQQRTMDVRTPTDHDGHALWKPVGVSPAFRYIRYLEGGQLVGHYDATYVESDERRTLMSMVIYLTTNANGATRFLYDGQAGLPMDQMDFSDWDRAGHDEEVMFRNAPVAGNAIIFDHRMLHDSEPIAAGDPEKIIIRTDIMFERI